MTDGYVFYARLYPAISGRAGVCAQALVMCACACTEAQYKEIAKNLETHTHKPDVQRAHAKTQDGRLIFKEKKDIIITSRMCSRMGTWCARACAECAGEKKKQLATNI